MTDEERAEKIELVAEAIFSAEFGSYNPAASDEYNCWTWRGDGHSAAFKETYRLYAVAAVDALEGAQ